MDLLIREQDPLKQGLKHNYYWPIWKNERDIREQDPIKQGLKLPYMTIITCDLDSETIREQDPIKQGLKHFCCKL